MPDYDIFDAESLQHLTIGADGSFESMDAFLAALWKWPDLLAGATVIADFSSPD